MPLISQPKPVYTCHLDTPLGTVIAAVEGHALTGLWFSGQKYFPFGANFRLGAPDHPVFLKLQIWLADYFAGRNPPCDLQLEPRGTPFQKAVWQNLIKIPCGQVTTYGAIARKMAASRPYSALSARAVGQAVGRNPIAILIPCHRVVGADRSLTGYAAGLDRKIYLLHLEHIDLARAHLPGTI